MFFRYMQKSYLFVGKGGWDDFYGMCAVAEKYPAILETFVGRKRVDSLPVMERNAGLYSLEVAFNQQ